MSDHIAALSVAHQSVALATKAVARAKSKLAELQRLAASEQDELELLKAAEAHAEALRQLDGADSVPVNETRVARLAALDKSVPARSAAIAMQRGRVADAEAGLRAAQAELARPVLALAVEMQGEAVAGLREGISKLAPDLARLVAADRIIRATIGERFTVPDGSPVPFGGLATVNKVRSALPDRLKVPELTDALLFETAHAVSSGILNQIGDK